MDNVPGSKREPILRDGIAAVSASADLHLRLVSFGDAVERLSEAKRDVLAALVNRAMIGMVASLDPHSAYLPSSTALPGAYGGVGLTASWQKGKLIVRRILDGSQAALGDIRVGDEVVAIDGRVPDPSIRGDISGPDGAPVDIETLHQGLSERNLHRLSWKFAALPTMSSFMSGDVLVIRPEYLKVGTALKVKAAIESRKGLPLIGLVLDLRENTGGLLNEVVALAGGLTVPGDILFSSRARHPVDSTIFRAKGGWISDEMPSVVLMNGGTSAGAEMVAAGLLQSRAVSVGSLTNGSGTVQTVMPFSDRTGRQAWLRLTTSEMFDPSGLSWQQVGLNPDVLVPSNPRITDRETDLPRALPHGPSIGSGGIPPPQNAWRVKLQQTFRSSASVLGQSASGKDPELIQALVVIRLLAGRGPDAG